MSEMLFEFKERGFVHLRGIYPLDKLEAFRGAIMKGMSAILGAEYPDHDVESLDQLFSRFSSNSQERVRELFLLMREVPEFYDLMLVPKVLEVSKALLGADFLHIHYAASMFRVDSQSDKTRQFPWHQEYPYILGSLPGLTVWAPLTSLEAKMGPMQVIPLSHRELLPVKVNVENSGKRFAGQHLFEINSELIHDYETNFVDLPEMEPGDAIFLHGLLVHRSGTNHDPHHARWSFLTRYSDGNAVNLVKCGRRTPGNTKIETHRLFSERHPDKVAADNAEIWNGKSL